MRLPRPFSKYRAPVHDSFTEILALADRRLPAPCPSQAGSIASRSALTAPPSQSPHRTSRPGRRTPPYSSTWSADTSRPPDTLHSVQPCRNSGTRKQQSEQSPGSPRLAVCVLRDSHGVPTPTYIGDHSCARTCCLHFRPARSRRPPIQSGCPATCSATSAPSFAAPPARIHRQSPRHRWATRVPAFAVQRQRKPWSAFPAFRFFCPRTSSQPTPHR